MQCGRSLRKEEKLQGRHASTQPRGEFVLGRAPRRAEDAQPMRRSDATFSFVRFRPGSCEPDCEGAMDGAAAGSTRLGFSVGSVSM